MISDRDHEQFETDGYVVVKGLLNVETDIQPVLDEYEGVLNQLVDLLYDKGELSTRYEDLNFGERLTKVYAECGAQSQFFDFSLPQADVQSDTPFWAGPAVFDMLRNKKLLEAVETFVGPEIYSVPVQHIRIKPPEHMIGEKRDNKVIQTPWHQDSGVILPEADESNILTVWFPLTDASMEQGCLEVLPGSHKMGLKHHCWVPIGLEARGVDFGPSIPLPMQAGDVLFMHSLTCHGSLRNVSDKVRISFDLRYSPIGHPTGRPAFPGFVVQSQKDSEAELHDPKVWENMWRETRDRLAREENRPFNRWSVDDPTCA